MGDTILFRFEQGKQNYIRRNYQNHVKTFDDQNQNRGIYELLCRRYIKAVNIEDITTRTLSIQPQNLENYLNNLTSDRIQQNFNTEFNNLKDFLENNVNEDIVLEIEQGVAVNFYNLENFAQNEEQRKDFLIKIFRLLNIIHNNGIVHRDIKPENLIYVTRNNSTVLVLNDWDISFILNNNQNNGVMNVVPFATLAYAAPEQLNNQWGAVGRKTDIWQAGMIAYRLYNNNNFPDRYNPIDTLNNNRLYRIFSNLIQNNNTFNLPENGNMNMKMYIRDHILNIFCDNRPTAADVLNFINLNNPPLHSPSPSPLPLSPSPIKHILAICCIVAVVIVASKLIGNKKSEQLTQSVPPQITSNDYEEKITEQTEYIEEAAIDEIPEQTKSQTADDEIDVPLEYYDHERIDKGYYTGYVDKDNKPHGEGCIEYDDGSKYEGAYLHGEFHGEGKFTTKDGTYYKGNWDMGELCDTNAEIKYSNGNTYLGGYSNGKYNGQGTYVLETAERGYQGTYSGTFVDGNFEGQGAFYYTDDTSFIGIFKNHENWNGDMKYSNGYVRKIEDGKYTD